MDQLLKFTELIRRFRAVKRKIVFLDDKQEENDAEHSYQLAITAWYLASKDNLNLDKEKVFKYALAHDLVEAYAGDTPAAMYHSYSAERDTKKQREEEAAERIKSEFPEFAELHEVIHAYEERGDEESKFVYALDKVLPVLNIYLDKGYSWQVHNVNIEDVIASKLGPVAQSPEVQKYFDLLIPMVRDLRGK